MVDSFREQRLLSMLHMLGFQNKFFELRLQNLDVLVLSHLIYLLSIVVRKLSQMQLLVVDLSLLLFVFRFNYLLVQRVLLFDIQLL